MASFDWLTFLQRWNAEIFVSRHLEEMPQQYQNAEFLSAIERKWLGFPGATESELIAAEMRLGTRLPASYRAFLVTSNGWLWPSHFIPKLWSTTEIAWLPFRHREGIDAWHEGERSFSTEDEVSVPDSEYFVYGSEQSEVTLRTEYLETALDISDREPIGTAMYLLSPKILHDGEWEAWFWAHWLPGARRYRSFADLMLDTYVQFHEAEQQSG